MPRKMKDSGIEWIGEIPEDWELAKFKNVAKLYVGDSIKDSEKDNYLDSDNAKNYIATKDVVVDKNIIDYSNTLYIKNFDYTFKRAPKGSTLICIEGGSARRKKAFLDRDVCFVNKLCCIKPVGSVYDKYIFYLVTNNSFENEFNKYLQGLIGGVSVSRLSNFNIPLPCKTKQKKISLFLDKEVKKINDSINFVCKQIQTLEDYKKSVITEAVTKGLDKNVEMKDSGIEWIGEIPKHWIKSKVKHACALIGSGTTPTSHNLEFYSEDGINWIQSGDLYKTSIITTTEKRISDTALKYYSVLKLYESPFLVMAMYGASVGNLSLSKINATTNQACCVMKPNKKTDLMFLYYWLVFVKDDLLNKAEGGSQPNISQDKIKNETMYFPTLGEQQSISNYLDKKTATIDEAIAAKQKQLEILEEYKKSLIYEYVTGKKEVGDVETI